MTRLTLNDAHTALRDASLPFQKLLDNDSVSVEFYRPRKVDLQQPHSRDEIYVIAEGSGRFINGSVQTAFARGDVLFVPAGVEHRFVDFTDDFATWVFFFGPERALQT